MMLKKSWSGAETESEFGMLDDFVLATVIEHVVLALPVAQWNTIRQVCRRWRIVSTPVLRRTLRSLWPRFVAPTEIASDTSQSIVFTDTLQMDNAKLAKSPDDSGDLYAWAFVPPLSLAAIGANGIGVQWTVSTSGGVYCGVFVGPRTSLPPSKEFHWTPHNAEPVLQTEFSSAVMGCYSGSVIKHAKGKMTSESNEDSSIGGVENGRYVVRLAADGTVTFIVDDKTRHTTAFFDEKERVFPKPLDNPDVVFTFAIGFATADHSAQLSRGRF